MKFYILFFWVSLNTIFWTLPLFLITGIKAIIPIGKVKKLLSKVSTWIGENWIGFNSWLIARFTKTKISIHGDKVSSFDCNFLVISNHRSWADIFILQKVFNRRIPLLRFFLKKELFWIPFLGPAFWALDFPFMRRYSKAYLKKYPEKAGKDLEITQKACAKLNHGFVSMMNFPEGTRITSQKHEAQNKEFRNLLKPKAGGIAYTLEAFNGRIQKMLDVTIVYPKQDNVSMADLLNSKISEIKVHIRQIDIPNEYLNRNYAGDEKFKTEFQDWVNQIWLDKDIILDQ
ncbi:MAG: acyltransferase [Bdellovibrionales bacterium]